MDAIKQYPHCDSLILHDPDDGCIYCNRHPEWQQLRENWGINFTGKNDPRKSTCPSEVRRPLETINMWGGNVPMTKERQKEMDEEFKKISKIFDRPFDRNRGHSGIAGIRHG